MDYLSWIDHLRACGIVSMQVRQQFAHMLRDGRPATRTQVLVFCNRMKKEYPEMWVAYRAKRRILEGVKVQ